MRFPRPVLALALLSIGCVHTPPILDHPVIDNNQCAQELARGDCKQAELYCDLGLEFAPRYADLWTNKGLIALCRQDKVRAREWFLKAIHIDPDQATAHLNLGRLYLEEGNDGKARDSFQRALELNPDDTEARYHLGLIDSRRGDRPEGR